MNRPGKDKVRRLYPEAMDEIYRTIPFEEIPWNEDKPSQPLVDLVESGRVRPCRTLDLGCGCGTNAIYLAGKGFEVTGVDISSTAVEIARERAKKADIQCTFLAGDLRGDTKEISGPGKGIGGERQGFDFAYDWEVLHHVFPDDREKYVKNVWSLLNPDAIYLSVCFSEDDAQFGGVGKYRRTQLGTVLYFSAEEELRELFSSHFTILELKKMDLQVEGKNGLHHAIYALMTK